MPHSLHAILPPPPPFLPHAQFRIVSWLEDLQAGEITSISFARTAMSAPAVSNSPLDFLSGFRYGAAAAFDDHNDAMSTHCCGCVITDEMKAMDN